MLLKRNLGSGKMELLKRKIESLIGILFKTMLCWLINRKWLKQQQKLNNKHVSVIVIIVSSKNEAKQLAANSF